MCRLCVCFGCYGGFAVGYLVLCCFVLLCDCAFDYGYYMRLLWLLRYCLRGGVCFLVGGGFAVGLRFCVGCVALLPVTVVLIGLLWIVCVGWWGVLFVSVDFLCSTLLDGLRWCFAAGVCLFCGCVGG